MQDSASLELKLLTPLLVRFVELTLNHGSVKSSNVVWDTARNRGQNLFNFAAGASGFNSPRSNQHEIVKVFFSLFQRVACLFTSFEAPQLYDFYHVILASSSTHSYKLTFCQLEFHIVVGSE